jgi:hypothetical protein
MKKETPLKPSPWKKFSLLLGTAALMSPAYLAAQTGNLKWSAVKDDNSDVTSWIRRVMVVIMAIFIMVSIVLGSLAFKQLAADGNWKDFWSKIAGAIGMFIVPVVVYYLVGI